MRADPPGALAYDGVTEGVGGGGGGVEWVGWRDALGFPPLSAEPLDGDGTGGYWLQIPGKARNWRRVRDIVTVENILSFQAALALLIYVEAKRRLTEYRRTASEPGGVNRG